MTDRRALAWAVLCLCLISLSVSLLQVRRASYPPSVQTLRVWRVSANSTVDLRGVQDVDISIADTLFENAFINYTEIAVLGADNPSVRTAWFIRSVGGPPFDIPYIIFHTEIEAKEDEVSVYYEFVLPQSIDISESSTMVINLHSSTNATYVEISGININGTQISREIDLKRSYQRYFLYTIPLHDYFPYKVYRIKIGYRCFPNNNMSDYTVVKMFNIFDGVPTVDEIPLKEGQLSLSLRGVSFPHLFEWKNLKPLYVNLYTTLTPNVSWFSTINLINYSWVASINETAGLLDVYLIMAFYRPADAPIVQARISFIENGQYKTINVMGNITEAFSSQPGEMWPRFMVSLPKINEIRVNVALMYWPSPWSEIALFSSIALVIEILVFIYVRLNLSSLLHLKNNVSESKDPQ